MKTYIFTILSYLLSIYTSNPEATNIPTISLLARQILEDQCHGPGSLPFTLPADPTQRWASLEQKFIDAQLAVFNESPTAGYFQCLSTLEVLLRREFILAFSCPLLTAKQVFACAQLSLIHSHPLRARTLLQMGNMFKLQAISQWYVYTQQQKAQGIPFANKYEVTFQADYSLALGGLFAKTQAMPLDIIQKKPEAPSNEDGSIASLVAKLRNQIKKRISVEIHSICNYKADPSSNTVPESPLTEWGPLNHQAYADKFNFQYVVHKELPEERKALEAHYSKMVVILEAMEKNDEDAWLMYIDCDAFFTDFTTSVVDIIETYVASKPTTEFLVAEDSGGINSGVFIVKNTAWAKEYFRRVSVSPYTTAWDQSQFFWEAVKENLFTLAPEDGQLRDFALPPQIQFMHQRHLNGFVPPASRDWQAYEWQPGDFVRHFAGCPWQEWPCLNMMKETMEWVIANFPEAFKVLQSQEVQSVVE